MRRKGRPVALREGTVLTTDIGDGRKVELAWFKEEDRDSLLRFYRELPKEEKLYLKDDVSNQLILDRFIEQMHDGLVLTILAWEGDTVVGETSQHFIHHGWSRHVSELRPLLPREYGGHHIERDMIREHIEVASELGLDKVIVRLLQVQKAKRLMLEKMGFVREATLKDHATDLQGKRHNMLIMSNYVAELWRRMEDLIRDTDYMSFPPPDL